MPRQSGFISGILKPIRKSFNSLYSIVYDPSDSLTSWLVEVVEPHISASVKEQSDKNELETSIGITVSTFLITIAVACVPIMTLNRKNLPISPEVFGMLGLFSLLTAALIIDSILDNRGYKFGYRLLSLFSGGYALFCLAISGISGFTIWLYRTQLAGAAIDLLVIMLITLSSLFTFLKLMSDDRDHQFGPLLPIFYIAVFSMKVEFWNMFIHIFVAVIVFTFLRQLGTKVHMAKDDAINNRGQLEENEADDSHQAGCTAEVI